MSQAYRVTVSRSVRETVSASDHTVSRVDLTEILPREKMRDLLLEALRRRGFEPQADGAWTRTRDGVSERFDPKTMEITATAGGEGTIHKERTVEAVGDAVNRESIESHRRHTEREVGERLEKELAVTEEERARKRHEIAEAARRALERTDAARSRDLHDATLEVYAEALKEKAKTLGTVEEVRENRAPNASGGEDYELVIRVRET